MGIVKGLRIIFVMIAALVVLHKETFKMPRCFLPTSVNLMQYRRIFYVIISFIYSTETHLQ